jgi:hypothetical protein
MHLVRTARRLEAIIIIIGVINLVSIEVLYLVPIRGRLFETARKPRRNFAAFLCCTSLRKKSNRGEMCPEGPNA